MKYSRLVAVALVVAAGTAGAQTTGSKNPTPSSGKGMVKSASYKKDLPDSLVKSAKITETAAAKTALAKVANGEIESVELEREGGKLLYSYDIKVAGKTGIDEVQVDAMTGATVGKVVHESPAAEKKEAADEAKEKKPVGVKAKKPPQA